MKRLLLHPNIRLVALFAAALALHLCGTWILPLVDRDEPRFSEASREMLQRGDWILPTFNNQPRYDKPPLTYWCQMVFYKAFGENDFAARFHSAFFTALTALVVYGFATRLRDSRTGWRAAIAFTVCLQAMVQAKAAVADMPMVFFVAVVTWAGWELITRPTARWWWIFYIALALGFLAKGPVAWLPIAGILIYAWRRKVLGVNGALKFEYGIPVVLLLVGLWGIPALLKTHGEFFSVGIGKHVVERSFSPMEGHGGGGALAYIGTLPLYFITVFVSFLPWTFFTGSVIRRLRIQCSDAEVYLLWNIAVIFVVFSLVKTKLPHYTLPAFPLLACLVAPRLSELPLTLFNKLAGGMVALNLVLSFAVFPFANSDYSIPIERVSRFVKLVTIKRFSQTVKLAPETEFASVDYDEPSQIWYFRSQLKTWHVLLQAADVQDFMAKPGPRLCVVPSELMTTLLNTANWELYPLKGRDIANGKEMSLVMLLKR